MASSEQKGYQPDSPDQKSKREKEIAKMEQFVLDMVSRTELETKASMDESLNKAINALENEKTETRERGKDNKPGGIVELRKDIPTLIIPDLHARKDYLAKSLMQRDPRGRTNLDKMMKGELQIVCLGDGMHSEGRGRERWKQAVNENNGGKWDKPSQSMNAEMTESFGVMKLVMELKAAHPEMFHYLRGNHDDILDSAGVSKSGVPQGALVKSYIENRYGSDVLKKYAAFEENLPLMVAGNNFVASHAQPLKS